MLRIRLTVFVSRAYLVLLAIEITVTWLYISRGTLPRVLTARNLPSSPVLLRRSHLCIVLRRSPPPISAIVSSRPVIPRSLSLDTSLDGASPIALLPDSFGPVILYCVTNLFLALEYPLYVYRVERFPATNTQARIEDELCTRPVDVDPLSSMTFISKFKPSAR